ncbi:MAG TPA: hypothetical protein VN963_06610, partial [bacterium]|nr:hypothetical protein [bacterium]
MTKIKHEEILTPATKDFFINMITKDITLEDCILDLIDNSIDCYLRNNYLDVTKWYFHKAELKKLKNKFINIQLNENEFSIKDNCGGLPLITARNGAFGFGASDYLK